MKVKIIKPSGWYKNHVGKEFDVESYDHDPQTLYRFKVKHADHIFDRDCVITELPKEFCVKRCEDIEKWKKYVKWVKNKYYRIITNDEPYPYYGMENVLDSVGKFISFGVEIHIDDIIKHIDYMESDDIPLAICKSMYKVGMMIKSSLGCECVLTEKMLPFRNGFIQKNDVFTNCGGYCLYDNETKEYAMIIKEETNMETQKLSRKGLKEIHSVACTRWKEALEHYGTRNPLEDYIELSEQEVQTMFNECTKEQLPIVSKYLKQDDGSIDVTKFNVSGKGFCDDNFYIIRDRESGEYKKQSFLLSERYDWEIKTDELGQLCLIPTKKK